MEQTKHALTWLIAVILFGGLAIAAGWALWRGRQVLPVRTCTLVPWTFAEILLAIVVSVGIPLVVFQVVRLSGFFRWYHGADPSPANSLDVIRAAIWVELSVPVTILATLLLLGRSSNARPWQFGFTGRSACSQVVLGYLSWLLFTPLTFAIHFLVNEIYFLMFSQQPMPHPVQQFAMHGGRPLELVLLVLQAVVWAPLREEFLLRGVILPWASRCWWGGLTCSVGAVAFTLLPTPLRAGPIVFAVSGCLLVMLSLRRKPEEQTFWANFGTSLLFAALHSGVWPTPIPLFVFGFALGWLQQRTQSLWGPIVLHGLFNAVSILLLLRGIGVK